jgi:zinc transport system substrate-binding protein
MRRCKRKPISAYWQNTNTNRRPAGSGRVLRALACGLAVAIIACGGCKPSPPENKQPAAAQPAATPLTIYASFHPVAYFAERIAGDTARVVCACPPEVDPALWNPDDATLAEFQAADLIVLNGAAFEKWPEFAMLPEERVVETADPLHDQLITIAGSVTHQHGPEGEHTHAGIDGHTWLDPLNARAQAETIRDALVARRPAQAETFKTGFAALAKDLEDLDTRFRALGPLLGERLLICSHPAYNYIARRYGWRVHSLHLDPESLPDADALKAIEALMTDNPAGLLLWEAAPADAVAALLSEKFKLRSVVFSPAEACRAGGAEQAGDYLTVMRANLDRLRAALAEQ